MKLELWLLSKTVITMCCYGKIEADARQVPGNKVKLCFNQEDYVGMWQFLRN